MCMISILILVLMLVLVLVLILVLILVMIQRRRHYPKRSTWSPPSSAWRGMACMRTYTNCKCGVHV